METRTSAEERPPALPVKQRRSGYSSSSADLEAEGGLSSPRGSLLHSPGEDVFPEPTDCQAALCPIHQRYDLSLQHQERFFSDSCPPPPVPKKSLVRTLSLPGGYLCPKSPGLCPSLPQPLSPGWSPVPPVPQSPHSYSNPLYIIASVPVPHQTPVQPAPLLPLSQLSFHTPDRLLPHFFRRFASSASVFQGLQQRHLLFLRGVAERLEAEQLLGGEEGRPEGAGGPLLPQDLLLLDWKPREIGGALYYRLHSSHFPGRELAAKVSRGTDPPPHNPPCPPHINIQQVLAHFAPQSVLCPSPPHEPSPASQPGHSASRSTHDGAIESAGGLKSSRETGEPSVAELLKRGWRVTLVRDLPQATLEDFVEEGKGLEEAEGQRYERQLGVLLLQLARGLQQLDSLRACTCVELHPQNVLLLWPRQEGRKGERQEERETVGTDGEGGGPGQDQGTGRAKGRNGEHEEMMGRGEKEEIKVGVQALWRKLGAPRVVVAHHTALSPPDPPPLALLAQFGAIIQYCLNLQEGASPWLQSPGLPHADSPYRPGLQKLSDWLREESSRLQIGDTVGILQVLLWGPRARLFSLNPARGGGEGDGSGPRPGGGAADEARAGGGAGLGDEMSIVQHWLSVKQALLILKLAEKGAHGDQAGLDCEDLLCLHYLSLTDPESVLKATARLGLLNTPN